MSVRGILYDLDGVLINSARAWFKVIEEGAKLCHRSPVTWEEFSPTFGQGVEADRDKFFPTWSVDQVFDFYERNFRKELDAIEIMDNALEVLSALKGDGIKQAVVTNTPLELAQCILTVKGLAPFIDVLAAAGEGAEKPAPDLLLLALERLDLSPHEVVYIGDSPVDVASTRAAGIRMIGLKIDGDSRLENLSAIFQHITP